MPTARSVPWLSRASLKPALAASIRITRPAALVAVTADGAFAAGTEVQVRVKERSGWSRWTTLHFDPEHGADPGSSEARAARPGTDPLMTVNATRAQVRIDTPSGKIAEGDRADAGARPECPLGRGQSDDRPGHRRDAGDRRLAPNGEPTSRCARGPRSTRPPCVPGSSITPPRRRTTAQRRRPPRCGPSTRTTPSPWATRTSTTTSSSTGSGASTRVARVAWTVPSWVRTPPGSTTTPSPSSPSATSTPTHRPRRTWPPSRTRSPGCSPGSSACTASTRQPRSSWSPPATSRRLGTPRARLPPSRRPPATRPSTSPRARASTCRPSSPRSGPSEGRTPMSWSPRRLRQG